MAEPKKVLIVDDDEAFAESIGDLLEAYGYEVHRACDGASGLEMAKRIRPDVMILDVMMTTATEGFEVARKIPESPELKRMGVLLVTGLAKSHHVPGGLRPDQTWLPVDRVLEKPIVPDHLILEMERVLKERAKG
jgi:CheY-like chemotaxis protein